MSGLSRLYTPVPQRPPLPDVHDIVRAIYPDPDPMKTAEEFDRAHHLDLSTMGPRALRRELARASWRLAFEGVPSDWLVERVRRLRKAVSK